MAKNKEIIAASETLLLDEVSAWSSSPFFVFFFFHLVHVHVKDIWAFHHAKEDNYLWLGFSIEKGSSTAVELEEGLGESLIFRPNPGMYG